MPRGTQEKQISEQLNAQQKVFSRAIKEVHRAEKNSKVKHSENYNIIHDIVSQIHKMQPFLESTRMIRDIAHNPQVPAINIVISGYDDVLIETPGTVSSKTQAKRLLTQIYKGCALWTKRNKDVARFVLSSRHHSLGNAIEHVQRYLCFDGVFAQDKRSRVTTNMKLKQYKRRCHAFGVSQQYFPDLVVNMKYIMTVALIRYAQLYNTDHKPIRIHILEEDDNTIRQILAACIDCCDQQVDKVYLLNMQYQPSATKYLGFALNADMPLPMEQLVSGDELEYKRDEIKSYAPAGGFTFEEAFTENLRVLQQDRYVHDPLEVTLYHLDRIERTCPVGVIDEKKRAKKALASTTVLVNSEYIDNLFHKMTHNDPDRAYLLLEPSTEDPYHRVMSAYYSPQRTEITNALKLYWNARRTVIPENMKITKQQEPKPDYEESTYNRYNSSQVPYASAQTPYSEESFEDRSAYKYAQEEEVDDHSHEELKADYYDEDELPEPEVDYEDHDTQQNRSYDKLRLELQKKLSQRQYA